FTVVEWVYATFSMRLRKFESKPLTWWVFGIAIGIFVYSISAAGMTLGQEQISWVVPGITVVAALAALVLMRRVQLDAFSAVQLGQTLADLCAEGLAAVRDNYPDLSDDGADRRAVDEPAATGGSAVAWEGPPAVFQELDESTLVSQLEARAGTCHFTVGVGSFLTPGMIIANVTGEPPIELARVLVTGVDRTPIQDPLLPVRLIVDIALKALSPALNDPATAVQAMDALEPILAQLAVRDLQTGTLRDRAGSVVATVSVPDWDDILSQLVDDLVVCGSPLPTSGRRLGCLLHRLEQVAVPSRKPDVALRLRHLLERSADLREAIGQEGY
ncbi:MAG: DUF2254 family protein, partial [Actinomycetes bacterium]